MKNKIFEDFANKKFNQLANYNIIMSKVKVEKTVKKFKVLNIAAVLLVVILIGIVTPSIYAKIKFEIQFKEYQNREFEYGYATLKNAIENGYVENIEMDYVTQDDIGVKVDSLLLSNSHLEVKLNFQFLENAKIDSEMFSYGYAIYDENKTIYGIVPRDHVDDSKEFAKRTKMLYREIGVKYNPLDILAIQLRSGSGIQNITAENYNIISKINMDTFNSFPRSKKLFIRVFDLGFYIFDENTIYDEDFKVSDSEWIFELDVPDKFYDISLAQLTLNEEIPGVKVNEIIVDDVEMKVDFDIDGYVDYASGPAKEDIEKYYFQFITISDEDGNVYTHYSGATNDNDVKFKFPVNKNMLDKKLFINIRFYDTVYTSELIKE